MEIERIKPVKLVNLEQIFQDRNFIIPDYQRGFSWEDKQINDLIKDIENLYASDHMHYTGTIVASAQSPDNPDKFEIVDGQQRLTTLIILLKCIYEIDINRFENIKNIFLWRGQTGDEQLVLEPNAEVNQFYKSVIIDGDSPVSELKSEEAIRAAKIIFKKWLRGNLKKIDIICNVVTKRLGFIFYTPKYDKEIGIMFEVINNRGKELSELEKIKNYFIYYATIFDKNSLRKDINQRWVRIQMNLSRAKKTTLDDENSFLRFCYLVYYESNTKKAAKIYETLKDRYQAVHKDELIISDNVKDISNFVKFLDSASRYYLYFFRDKEFLDENTDLKLATHVDKTIKRMRCHHVHASIMPIYLAVMHKLSEYAEEVVSLLNLLEILNFRVYILPEITGRTDEKQSDLFDFAHKFFNEFEWNSNVSDDQYTYYSGHKIEGTIFNWIGDNMLDFVKHMSPVEKFMDSLVALAEPEEYNYYNWKGIRFFLASYEEYLKIKYKKTYDIQEVLKKRRSNGMEANDYLSIEHIWASKNLSEKYEENFIEKRRLGNFALLGLNSNQSLSDNDIPLKIEELNDFNSKNHGSLEMVQVAELKIILKEASEYLDKDGERRRTRKYFQDLSSKINDIRENKFISFALIRWHIEGEKVRTKSKVDSFT